MILDNQEIVRKKDSINNMGKIICDGLKNPVVQHFCIQEKNKSYDEE